MALKGTGDKVLMGERDWRLGERERDIGPKGERRRKRGERDKKETRKKTHIPDGMMMMYKLVWMNRTSAGGTLERTGQLPQRQKDNQKQRTNNNNRT